MMVVNNDGDKQRINVSTCRAMCRAIDALYLSWQVIKSEQMIKTNLDDCFFMTASLWLL